MDYLQQTNLGRGLTKLIRNINHGADGEQIGEDLFGVADLLRSNQPLARAITDPSRTEADRKKLAHDLFADHLAHAALQSVYDLVGDRWTRPDDLATTLAVLGLDAYILAAVQDKESSTLAYQLIEASELIKDNRELRIQLSDLSDGTPEERSALAMKVFHGHVSPIAERLIGRAAASSDYGRILQTLRSYADRAAELDGKRLVVATTANPLTDAQIKRMEELASRRFNEPVELVPIVDSHMLGGFKMDGGERFVDTSIRTDIAAAREVLTR